jgi:porin
MAVGVERTPHYADEPAKLGSARKRSQSGSIARVVVLLMAAAVAAHPVTASGQSVQPPLATGLTGPLAPADTAAAPPISAQLAAPAPVTLPVIGDTTNPAALDYVGQRPLFEDFWLRQDLAARGIDFIAHYISETVSNTQGVKGTGTAYAQQVDFGLSFDLTKLNLWPDAVARFAMTDRAGRSLAADKTDSYFAYQEIFGQGQNLRFNEISVEQFLLSKEVAVKVGFYPMGSDFSTLPYVCNFVNVAFCGHPQSLPVNSGWSDAPAGRWGGRVKWNMTDELTLQTGLFDVNPLVTRRQDGFKLDLNGSTGVITPLELGYQLGKNPSDYGGTYKIGAYYDSSTATDLANAHESDAGRYGLYLEAAQQIFKTGPDLRNGLALFGIYTVSDQNTAKFKDYFEAGAAYRGLFPGRELDILSAGWVRTDINSRFQYQLATAGLPAQTNEQLVEFNYAFQLTPSLIFRPDVQYDMQPGATSTHPNTWILGFQVKLTL